MIRADASAVTPGFMYKASLKEECQYGISLTFLFDNDDDVRRRYLWKSDFTHTSRGRRAIQEQLVNIQFRVRPVHSRTYSNSIMGPQHVAWVFTLADACDEGSGKYATKWWLNNRMQLRVKSSGLAYSKKVKPVKQQELKQTMWIEVGIILEITNPGNWVNRQESDLVWLEFVLSAFWPTTCCERTHTGGHMQAVYTLLM